MTTQTQTQQITIGSVFNLLFKLISAVFTTTNRVVSVVDNVTTIAEEETNLWKALHESSVIERQSEAELKLRTAQSKIEAKLSKLK